MIYSIHKVGRFWTILMVLLILIVVSIASVPLLRHAGIIPQANPRPEGMAGHLHDLRNAADDLRRDSSSRLDNMSDGFVAWRDDLGSRFGDMGQAVRHWRDDLGRRASDASESVVGPIKGVGGIFQVFLDIIGNLHIMLPVILVFLLAAVFGGLKTKAKAAMGIIAGILFAQFLGFVAGAILGTLVLIVAVGAEHWKTWLNIAKPLPGKLSAQIHRLKQDLQRRRKSAEE